MQEKIDKRFLTCFLMIWTVLMAAAFYFCTLKQGFHEDELYTYYSTARTNGFYVEDGKWMDRETIRREFVVLPGERFQYGLVKQVQSWDVHPPMYYWVFHTAASLVPGVFSKWIGLSVNLFFHGIHLALLTYLSWLACGKRQKTALIVTLFYGLTPAAMSGVVFIRMYEMLTVFVLLCAVLHVQAVQRLENEELQEKKLPLFKCLLPLAAVTYVGFLTQYYYFIFLFYMAMAFCVYLIWHDRNLYNCLRYGISQAAALGLAYLTYPACLGQMFRGQRGAQATANFFDLSNTLERIWFFLKLMNGYVFGYRFFGILLLAVIPLAVRVRRRGGRAAGRDPEQNGLCFGAAFWMLLFAAVGYFLTVSKTALLLGETSNRYQLPVYGLIVFLVFYSCKTLWRQAVALSNVRPAVKSNERPGFFYRLCPSAVKVLVFVFELIGDLWSRVLVFLMKYRKYTEKAALLFCLLILVIGYLRVDVVFLYPESREQVALAREQAAADIPVVYVYRPGEEWCIWAVADVLMEYDSVYFLSVENEEPIREPAIADADALAVYLPFDGDGKEEAQDRRIAASCKLTKRHRQYQYKYCEAWYYGDGQQ